MSLEMKRSKLLRESFTTRGDIPPKELEKNKLECLNIKISKMKIEEKDIKKGNMEALAEIQNSRRKKKRVKMNLSRLENRLTVLKVKEDHKLAQINVIAERVEKASEIFNEKRLDSELKERKKNFEKIELINLKKNVLEAKGRDDSGLQTSKELDKLKKRVIKNSVLSKNNELKRKKLEKEMKLRNMNKYKNIKINGIKKSLKISKQIYNRKTKILRNRAFIEEWLSNEKLIKRGLKEYKDKNKKYTHMIKNIFKAQDMLDKYQKIYESIKNGKLSKKKNSETKVPNSRSVDFDYGFLPDIASSKRNSSLIDDWSTRRTTKRSVSVEDHKGDACFRGGVFTCRSRDFESVCDIKGEDVTL